MLRRDSRWTLQVKKKKKKTSYKDVHLPLGVVGGMGVGSLPRGALFCPTLKRVRSACARERGVCARNSPQEP